MTEIQALPFEGNHRPEDRPLVGEGWKWTTSIGNFVIGAAEMLSGGVSFLSVTGDAVHNFGDAATYYTQANNVIHQHEKEGASRREFLHKAGYWVISAASAATMVKAGIDWKLDRQAEINNVAVYAASASLAFNGLLLAQLYEAKKRLGGFKTVYERVLSKHFWAVDIPSAGFALAGALLQKHNVDIEQGLGVASGLLGVYAFRPTKKNMQGGGCHGHGH